MAMVQGLVEVDDNGNETFTPDDDSNTTKKIYQALLAANSTIKKKSKVSGGAATWTPPKPTISNPPTPEERAAFAAWQASNPVMTPPPPPTTVTVTLAVTPDAVTKQKTAEMAAAISIIIPQIQTYGVAVIPNTSAGDGLMRDSGGGACQHPTSQKTIKIQ